MDDAAPALEPPPAPLPPEAVRGRAGLEALREMAAGRLPRPPMAALMDIRLVEVEAGRAVFEGRPGPQHFNPMGVVHGGFALTLLDSALGCAVHATCAAGEGYTTIETKGTLHKAIRAGDVLRCEGRVISRGRRVAAAVGEVTDPQGVVVASGTSTCLLFPTEAA